MQWAEPGSRHDRLIRLVKYGLPLLIAALVVLLAVAPFDKRGDVSFILDKKKVAESPERMRVERARYTGEDDKGQKFQIIADHAVQHSSNLPVVEIEGMMAELGLAQGPLRINAPHGRYDLDAKQVAVVGPIMLAGGDGYRLQTSNVIVDLNKRTMASRGPVDGAMRLGRFHAGQMHADLNSRTVTLDGGARLKIVQGAVK